MREQILKNVSLNKLTPINYSLYSINQKIKHKL